jgi:outer membrane protein assembly factor BamB
VIEKSFFKNNTINVSVIWSYAATFSIAIAVASLSACSGGANAPKPAELGPNAALIGIKQVWVARIGAMPEHAALAVSGKTVAVAAVDGTVALLDAASGIDIWRANAAGVIATGAGSDGKRVAVATKANEVVAFEAGKQIWREKLPAQIFTAPFVAGGRVFVLSADRNVTAFDGATGRKLWTQQRPGEPLVLKQGGTMLAVGDTLVVGLSGKLVGFNPNSGSVRWEAPIASPRGTNEVERLVDMVGTVSRVGDVVCARAFQAAVGCVNAAKGSLLWTQPARGREGVHGDESFVFGTESDGKVLAWKRSDGTRAWVSDRLAFRGLSAPVSLGRSIVLGDKLGVVHVLAKADGSALTRMSTDGSAVEAAPVVVGDTVVVATRLGSIFGFAPE